jgi:hypothetical protein
MNDRTKAAVIGGVAAGVLSVIPLVGACCFLWAIGGGFLAVFMYMKSAPAPMAMGDGAKLGATAGVVAAILSIVIGIPFLLLGIGSAAMNQDVARAGITSGIMALGGVGLLIVRAICLAGFGALGGVIGVAALGKNRPGGMGTPPPPPPSDFGGGGYTPPPPAGGSGTYGSGS